MVPGVVTPTNPVVYDVTEISLERHENGREWHTGDTILGELDRIVIRVHSHRTCIAVDHAGDFVFPEQTTWCIESPFASCPGDITGDNVVGGPDYTSLIFNWGRNCNR